VLRGNNGATTEQGPGHQAPSPGAASARAGTDPAGYLRPVNELQEPSDAPAFDTSVPPSGEGCADCDAVGGWWVHLRRCAACGHVGCCDSSPAQHASGHYAQSGHRVVQSFEPGEDWFWDYLEERLVEGPALAEPTSRPDAQPAPGPKGRVPVDWRSHVH